MEAEFWHQRWQNNQIGFHQPEINTYLKTYWQDLALKSDAHVFVPLCGKSSDLLWLAEQGYKVTGVELSQQAAEAFFEENNLSVTKQEKGEFTIFTSGEITIYAGDYFKTSNSLIGEVDAVYDRAALIALPESMRQKYVLHMQSLIKPEIPVLLVTMVYPQEQMDGPPFSVSEDEVRSLFADSGSLKKLIEVDLLEQEKRFAEKGVISLSEIIYSIVV